MIPPSPQLTLPDRFWVMVTPCIIWHRAINAGGYGVKWRQGRLHRAHRLAYEEAFGPIPAGLELDHLCRNRACVNPDHLEAVTHAENLRRADRPDIGIKNRLKVTCPQGHLYDAINTYRVPSTGKRVCRSCHREAERLRCAQRRSKTLDYAN